MTCNEELKMDGRLYPRTCARCGLGPCVHAAEPQQPVQTRTAPDPGVTRGVVIGESLEVVYGPYDQEYGEQLAQDLTSGRWKEEGWMFVPLGRLPGEKPPPPPLRHPLDAAEVRPLYEFLERRQGGDDAS